MVRWTTRRARESQFLWILAMAVENDLPLDDEVEAFSLTLWGRNRTKFGDVAARMREGRSLIDALEIGRCVVDLGGGRRQPEDEIDPLVGVVLRRACGDAVAEGEVIASIHAGSEQAAGRAATRVAAAYGIARDPVVTGSRILARTSS